MTSTPFSSYRELSKSGIVALVLISVLGGYLCGHPLEKSFSWIHCLWTLGGVLFLASGSSALNQLQEQGLDAQMPRTAKRPLPSGRISRKKAALFIGFNLGAGLFILSKIHWDIFAFGLAAVLAYNGLYTLWWKKHWPYAAVPGAIPGALPILIGYTAANEWGHPAGGFYLFFMLFFWQMPHFWVLALRYRQEYAHANIPTLPVTHGAGITVSRITVWCLSYVGLALIAPLFLKVGALYLTGALLTSGKILWELRSFARTHLKNTHVMSMSEQASREATGQENLKWLRFFLWVNFSLIIYISLLVLDLWSVRLQALWV